MNRNLIQKSMREPALFFLLSLLMFSPFFHQMQTASAGSNYYRDYNTFMTDFKNLSKAYPSLISYQVVGKTVLNRDILMFTIGNPGAQRVLFDGAIHGEETLGSELLLDYAKWLLTSNDPLAENILSRACTLLIPAVNVDNFNYIRTNAHHVDLNRNFATDWANGGDASATSWEYRGPSPLSELESRTLLNVFKTYKPKFYVNLHSSGGAYYLESTHGNQLYYTSLTNQINALSKLRGVTPYPDYSTAGAGFAISDAAKLGITSFLLELTPSTTISLSGIETTILPKFLPIAAVISQGNGTEALFTDSFESGDFGNWDGTQTTSGETLSTANTLARQGRQSGLFTADGSQSSGTAYCYKNLQDSTSMFARGYFIATSFIDTASYGKFYFTAFAASGKDVAMAGCLRSGNVTYWRLAVRNGTNWLLADSKASQFINQWHRFELQWTRGSTNGWGKLYVDGKMVSSISGINTTAYGAVDSVKMGIAQSEGAKTTFHLDYVQLSRVSLGPLPIIEDLNQDGRVDMKDISICSHAFWTVPSSADWDSRSDLNADSKIDMSDMSKIVVNIRFE